MSDAGALCGLRILELGDERAAWCGKLLADMGAEVIKIEPPGGSADRSVAPMWEAEPSSSLSFLYQNTSKKSITLDLSTAADREHFVQLLATADALVEALPAGQMARWGLGQESLAAQFPHLVMTSISGFGQCGPHSHFNSADIVAAAMGGAMGVTGHPDDPPVVLAGRQANTMTGTVAAVSTLLALHHVGEGGAGQQVDISAQEVMLAVTSISGVGKWLDDDIVPHRFGAGLFAAVPSGTYPCSDGRIYLIINRPLHWQVLARWVHDETGNEEILDPMFEGPSANRQPYRELLDLYLSEFTRRFSVENLYREGQRRHLAMSPLNRGSDIATDHHLHARGFYAELDHSERSLQYPGPPYRFSKTPWRMAGAAPGPGQHNAELATLLGRERPATDSKPAMQRSGSLAGLRVVEFTAGMAGPWIGRMMAWCGAEVIKVESRNFPDVTRLYVPPREPELGPQTRVSPWFTDWNAGKRFVSLDLTQPGASELAGQLIAESDIVIDNNGNGVLEKLGLGFEQLHQQYPELILLSSTGYGKSGPDATYISWGPNIETLSGLAFLSGFAHRECTMTQFAYPDPLSAYYGLFAILCALAHRRDSGEGQVIAMSQLEATVASLGTVLMEALAHNREPAKPGNASQQIAPQGCYPCSGDERWCVLSIADETQWQHLCQVLRRHAWLEDARFQDLDARLANQPALDALIGEATATWEAHGLMEQLQAQGIAAGVVQNVVDQYQRDRHLRERGYFERINHEVLGEVIAPGMPLGLTGTPGKTRGSGRAIGSDNQGVFCGLLGLSQAEYAQLVAAGVIED